MARPSVIFMKKRITKEQKEIIIGLMLGDGYLETQDRGRTYRLGVVHSFKEREYVKWLYEKLRNWCQSGIKEWQRKDGRKFVGFRTISSGSFRFYAHQFYDKSTGRKKVPKLIHRWLTPLAIAVWFMDDGSIKSKDHRTYIFHTDGFTRQDLMRLQKALESKFAIKTSIHKQKRKGKKYYRLYILTESAEKFKSLIEPFIHSTMRYKLGNKMPKR